MKWRKISTLEKAIEREWQPGGRQRSSVLLWNSCNGPMLARVFTWGDAEVWLRSPMTHWQFVDDGPQE